MKINSSCCLQPHKYMWHISSKNHGYLTLKFNPRHVKNYFIDYPYKEMYYVQITMSATCLFLLQLQIRFFLSCWANVRPSVECNYLNQTNGQPLMVQQNIRIKLSQFALEVVSWNVKTPSHTGQIEVCILSRLLYGLVNCYLTLFLALFFLVLHITFLLKYTMSKSKLDKRAVKKICTTNQFQP